MIRLTQDRIFQLLVDLEIDPESVDVNKLFKNAAEIGKASVTQKKFTMEARAAIEDAARKKVLEEQRAKLEAMPTKGGVTAETKAAIREALVIACRPQAVPSAFPKPLTRSFCRSSRSGSKTARVSS